MRLAVGWELCGVAVSPILACYREPQALEPWALVYNTRNMPVECWFDGRGPPAADAFHGAGDMY